MSFVKDFDLWGESGRYGWGLVGWLGFGLVGLWFSRIRHCVAGELVLSFLGEFDPVGWE